jgi:hypothetical protein
MDNIWLDIVKEALKETIDRSGVAPSGAKLRMAVASIANARGLSFPPPDMGKFSSFVESFPADLIVHRRPGQDILVVPANRPELLATENTHSTSLSARIREDMFEALTKIPTLNTGKAFYIPETDSVVWVKPLEQAPASAIEFPETSLLNEIEVRKRFVTVTNLPQQAKDALTAPIATDGYLRSFSNAVHSYGLVKQWHQFRLGTLSQQLREWSVNKAIEWQQSWVDLAESKVIPVTVTSQPVIVDNKKLLREIAPLLTDEDLSRISIPLDVVLRLLSSR